MNGADIFLFVGAVLILMAVGGYVVDNWGKP